MAWPSHTGVLNSLSSDFGDGDDDDDELRSLLMGILQRLGIGCGVVCGISIWWEEDVEKEAISQSKVKRRRGRRRRRQRRQQKDVIQKEVSNEKK